MKIYFYKLVIIFFILIPIYSVFPQEIEATLGGSTSDQGFSIKNNINNTLFRVTGEGNVGIGNSNPSQKLDVNGSIGWGTSGAFLGTDHGASIELRGQGTPYIDFTGDQSDYNVRLVLTYYNTLNIEGAGVGIGTENTNGYKLAVAGNVIAEEIVVKLQQNWPDYVFEKDYKRMDYKELENYLLKNKHLPNLPNSSDINNKGLNIGEIQTKLLEKIEELTLYLIDQNKEIEKLKSDYDLLKKKIEEGKIQ